MCQFFYQLTSYLPNQVSRWQFIVLESMVPLIAWHSAQTYPHWLHLYCLPAAIWACAIRTNDVIWPIIREQQLSYGHYDHVHPCHPHPCRAKGPNDHLFVLCEHSRLARAAPLRMQRCTRRSAIIRRPIVISKRQIFPFRVRIGE